ncbi:MAG: choice-of-anchor Q domain-containing protein [Microcoleaceae cyanobacterium MO_207.B10]|nr:choice-of-anchor Q domain-containing protein [Microcoleaceae cyanobacterium MO_207.B10]
MGLLTVQNNSDNGTGSLREAIALSSSGDTIVFDPSLSNQTITLTTQLEIPIGRDLTIDGTAAPNLTISGNNQTRIFHIDSASVNPTDISLKNLNLIDGSAQGQPDNNGNETGGAIRTEHQASLDIDNIDFSNNTADDGGGAIYIAFEGNLTVNNSKFDSNKAIAGNSERGAGGIAFRSPNNLTITNSEFTNNLGINGAAINSLQGNLTIDNTKFFNNDTTAAFYDEGNPRPFLRGFGGAIYTDRASSGSDSTSGQINITNSTFEGNKGRGEGGAAYLYTGTQDIVNIEDSVFRNNEILPLPNSENGQKGNGGAIVQLTNGTNKGFTIANTSIVNNTSSHQGGGLWMMGGPSTIINSTFSGNQALGNSSGSIGGAMALYGDTDIVNSTIAYNHAYWVAGAMSAQSTADVTLKNTIFYENTAFNGGNDWNIQQHTTRELIGLGNNLQYPEANQDRATTDIVVIDPQLDSLTQINGFWVHPLLAGSPAIDGGTSTGAPSTDQLGQARPVDGDGNGTNLFDIGALEFVLESSPTPDDQANNLQGTPLEDTIDGLGGNDTIKGLASDDIINGGDGDDNIGGGVGNDTLEGNSGNDSITGWWGNDEINGGVGNDTLQGGDGMDTIYGAADADTIKGGTGNDLLNGDGGNDFIQGQAGDDEINGGNGNDTLGGGADNDIVNGDAGSDSLTGWIGDDILDGGIGNDTIKGGDGFDTLTGGKGNDWLAGGNDSDRFIFDNNSAFNSTEMGVDTIKDFSSAEVDKIILSKATFTSLNSALGNGFSVGSEFAVVNTDADAAISSAEIVYNSTTGGLFYNQNGSTAGFGTGSEFAAIEGTPTLQANDFILEV